MTDEIAGGEDVSAGAPRSVQARRRPTPDLWTRDIHASRERVGRLIDAHGIAQTIMVQLTGGVFLTGFALALGASEIAIGVLAALPLAVKLGQLVMSWWIERRSHWRQTAMIGGTIGRMPLIVGAIIALFVPAGTAEGVLLVAVTVAAIGASVFEMSLITWIAELVPTSALGEFWGRRWRISGVIGIGIGLLASFGLDRLPRAHDAQVRGFVALFVIGGIVGLLGLIALRHVPLPRREHSRVRGPHLHEVLTEPVRDVNYRRYLYFAAAWSFSSGFMAPFFNVYMLRILGLSFLEISVLTAITNMLMALSQPGWGRLADHFGSKPVLRVGTYLILIAPFCWLGTTPARVWPVILAQIVSGFGWGAHHLAISNLGIKLSPSERRPSYLAAFGAVSGAAEAVAPLVGGALLVALKATDMVPLEAYHVMIAVSVAFFAAATVLPGVIYEPSGAPVGHMVRVMGRFRSMDASQPVQLLFEYTYTHVARVADLIAREWAPRAPEAPAPS